MLNLLPRVRDQACVVTIVYTVAATTVWLAIPRAADPVSGDWPSYNRTLTSDRFRRSMRSIDATSRS